MDKNDHMPLEVVLERALYAHRRLYGTEHEARIVDQLIEESGELIKELLKRRRGFGDRRSPIKIEMIDLVLCLYFLCDEYDFDSDTLNRRLSKVAWELAESCEAELARITTGVLP